MALVSTVDYGLPEIRFNEETDLKNYSIWICDVVHCYPAWTPFYTCIFDEYCGYGMQYGAEMLSCPESKGWNWKFFNGYTYLTVIEPKPEEVPEREKLFRERITPFLEDPEAKWAKESKEILGLYKHIQQVDIAKVSLHELRDIFYEAVYVYRRGHEIHFYWMYAMFIITHLFQTVCEELTGIKPDDPLHGKLVSGFDSMLYKADKEIGLLGGKAREAGLADVFLTTEDNEQLLSKLEQSEAGRRWLEGYRQFIDSYGWRNEHVWDWASPSWIERPSLGLRDVKRAVAKVEPYGAEVMRERLAGEREQARQELLAIIPAEQREWFKKLLGVAQMSAWWSEDHNYYLDYPMNAVPRKVITEIGRRLAQAGAIDEPFDIFMLMPWEIRKAIVPMERENLRLIVSWRKEEWQKALKIEPIPFLGPMEKLGELVRKDAVVGVEAAPPRVRPELKADLYGASSAPGTAEGVARVVMSEEGLKEIQPGEILVSPYTGPTWIPAFNIIKAVVTDMGGTLAHAVIVGREFGLPAVAGTIEATRKIKSGQRIKVDGDVGAVYILG